ncbi:MAG: hypothetical protein JJU45_16235 [Acidimicrobiia bacterium]|nr:hypothetical protein [Acidimicrobiia bacterium]
MTGDAPRIEFIEARRVLLDALGALQPHIGAVVLVGAQAVYLRTAERLPTYQAFTTDADLVIDPNLLADVPLLGDAMVQAGFDHTGEPGIWERRVRRDGSDDDITVPVDLIVPSQIAAQTGRRGARLPGGHGKTAARKSDGVEGALVDHDPVAIAALEDADPRHVVANVAGPAALVVAKAHKLGERLERPERLLTKDAGDVYRLFDAYSVQSLRPALDALLDDERSRTTTEVALDYLRRLFATPRSPGIGLTVHALDTIVDRATVAGFMTDYTRDLLAME